MSGATTRLQLPACGAARAFARRRIVRRTGRQRIRWTPTVLRWRRASALVAREPGVPRAAANSASPSWQLHMHLRVEAGAAARQVARAESRTQAVPKRAMHPSTEMRRDAQRTGAPASAANLAVAKSRDNARLSPLHPGLHVAPAMRSTRASTKRPPPMATMQFGKRRSDSLPLQDERTPIASRHATRSVPLRRHRSRVSAPHPAAARPSSVIEAIPAHSPDLVWRTSDPRTTSANEPTQTQASNASRASAGTASPEPGVEISSPQAAHADLRPQPLDPAFVDRLADDVIRRIDRRLRIERERRGL